VEEERLEVSNMLEERRKFGLVFEGKEIEATWRHGTGFAPGNEINEWYLEAGERCFATVRALPEDVDWIVHDNGSIKGIRGYDYTHTMCMEDVERYIARSL
jgi:hypothetical protein